MGYTVKNMSNIDIITTKNSKNTLKLGKKFLIGLLDFILFFLLASVFFSSYEAIIHSTSNYNDKIVNVSRYEEELADISVSSNLTEYIVDEQGNKYLKSIESIAHEYVVNQVYTALVNDDRDFKNDIFINSKIINIENDVCLYYINTFKNVNQGLFISENTLTFEDYRLTLFDNVSNEINFIYNDASYPIFNISVATKIYNSLVNNTHQELDEYNLVKNSYQQYLEKCINDFMTNYQPYIETQDKYNNSYDSLYRLEIIGLFVSYILALFIYYFLIPLIINDRSTLFMKLFRLKPLNNDKQCIDFVNLICRFISLFIVYLFTLLLMSFSMHDINTFINIIFTDFLKYFNIFTLGTLSILLKICNMLFTLYNPKKKQTIVEAISQITIFEDKTLKKIQIGNREFEIKN